jgi:hypothetical protein
MSRAGEIFAGLGILGAGGLVAWYLFLRHDDGGSVLDQLGDTVNMLTSSEQDRIAALEPGTQAAVVQLVANLAARGVRVHVGQTLRTPAGEKAVIAAGRSAVTTHSWHEIGRAADIYPLLDDGSIDWDAENLDNYRALAEEAVALGFRSLAFNADGSKHLITNSAGKKIWDGGHVEFHGPFATIADAVAAEGAAFGIA